MVVSLLSLVILLLSSGMRRVKERTDDLTYNTPPATAFAQLAQLQSPQLLTRNFRFRRADPEGEARPSKQVRANDFEGRKNERYNARFAWSR